MKTHLAVALQPLMERGDIRKSDQRLRRKLAPDFPGRESQTGATQLRRAGALPRPGRQPRQQPHGSIPAARTKHRLDVRVLERSHQLVKAPFIVTRQVTMPRQDALVITRRVASADESKPRLKGRPIKGPRRRHDGDRIARPNRGRFMKKGWG
jgi:hypothetical protein